MCSQIYATLYDYPCLKQCEGLKNYIESCIHTAWGLSVQRPPFIILYDSKVYQPDLHMRVEPSNNQSILIQNILWPALLQTSHGPCVHRAIVQTWPQTMWPALLHTRKDKTWQHSWSVDVQDIRVASLALNQSESSDMIKFREIFSALSYRYLWIQSQIGISKDAS